MQTLYELTNDYLALLDMAEDPDTDEQAFKDTLEGLDGEIEIKADGYAKVMKELSARADALKAEAARFTARQKACEASVDRMKKHLEESMRAIGKTKFKTDLFSFGIQKNPPSVKIGENYEKNPELIPMDYLEPQDPKINKKKIMEELKAGKKFPFATLEQGESLRIR